MVVLVIFLTDSGIKLLKLIFFSREHRFIMTVALANIRSIYLTALTETGDETSCKHFNSKRQKKWLVTLPGTTAKGTRRVFLIALHISKTALKFYCFDKVGLKEVSSSTFSFYPSV